MDEKPPASFTLTLGDVMSAAKIDSTQVMLIRHTFRSDGLGPRDGVTRQRVLEYTREQLVGRSKIPENPPRWWLIFLAESGRRCRLWTVYENRGEIVEEQTETCRYFNLQETDLLTTLQGRLLIEWTKDTVNWVKRGPTAARFPVIEIADPQVIEFPGYDQVLLTHTGLQEVVQDSRYTRWQAALGAVKGIYLITDTTSGKHYVGKADGADGILGRWRAYAQDGHGGNVALRGSLAIEPEHARHYLFSILRVFGTNTPPDQIDDAENHYKAALLSTKFGLNRN